MEACRRLYFLDNLKVCIIGLMVVFHAAMSYMACGPAWWYVVDDDRSLAATAFVIWADVFIMPVMFFIAGYMAPPSLRRHGSRSFWRRKAGRIAVPWIAGAVVIAPYITYLTIASRDIPMGCAAFYQTVFWGPLYQQGPYWFLGFLLLLYAVFWSWSRLAPDCLLPARRRPATWLPVLVWGGMTAAMTAAGLCFSDDIWIHPAYILVFQPVRAPIYGICFFLGAYGWRRQWFYAGYVPSLRWGAVFFLASSTYVAFRLGYIPGPGAAAAGLVVRSALHCLVCLSAVLAALAFFQRYIDRADAVWRQLAVLSYPVYYIHQLVVQHTVWLFRTTGLPLSVKYSLVCAVSLLLSALAARYVLLRLPCFRRPGA